MALLLRVCLSFLKIGAFSFGGGYAVLAMIQREVVEANGWLDPADFVNIVAIAEMTPGPVAVNAATFVGYNLFGVGGGILCTLCVLAIPFLLCLTVAVSVAKLKDNPYLKAALSGIRPVVIGIIGAACLSVAQIAIVDGISLFFFTLALLLIWKWKVSPILTLVICSVLGVICGGWLFPLMGVG